MKRVVINVGKTEYGVASLGDDLKPLPNEWEVGIMLSVAIDRMIEFGYSKKMIMEIINSAYESRLQSHNSNK